MSSEEKIMAATTKIMAQKGFAETKIEEIVQEAQVSLSIFYDIFSGKEEILEKIFSREFLKRYHFYQNMRNWHIDWFLKINGILNFHLQEMQNDPELTTLLLTERMNPSLRQKEPVQQYTQLTTIIAAILQEALHEGKIPPCDIEAIATIIYGFTDTLSNTFMLTGKSHQLETTLENFGLLLKNGLDFPPDKGT